MSNERAGKQRGEPSTDSWSTRASSEPAASIKAQRDAIQAGRLLMQSPDPVRPLINELSDILRTAVLNAASAVKTDQARALADIEASPDHRRRVGAAHLPARRPTHPAAADETRRARRAHRPPACTRHEDHTICTTTAPGSMVRIVVSATTDGGQAVTFDKGLGGVV